MIYQSLPMVCRRPTMFVASSPTARKLSMHWESCAPTACVIRQIIFRSVIVAKFLYSSSAWWGFTNATDRPRINAFLRRSICCGLCLPDLLLFEEQCQAAGEQLFHKILANNNNVLHSLLPPPTVAPQNYNLRPRAHNRQLILHSGHLTDWNFLTRVLYSNIYKSIKLIS